MPLPMAKEDKPAAPYVIAVAAGKGGVGKSTVTVQLARAWQKKGFRVGILDGDLYGPSIRKIVPEDRLPQKKGERWDAAFCDGIRVMSLAFFRQEGEAAAVRAPIANGFIQQFLERVNWGELDILLIDFPPGTGDIQMTLCQKAALSGAVLVTTPQELSLLDVQKATHLFHQLNVPIIGVVENMSFLAGPEKAIHPFGQGGGKRIAEKEGVPLLGQLPLDPDLCSCCDLGVSFWDKAPEKAGVWQSFAEKTYDQLDRLHQANVEFQYNGEERFTVRWPDGCRQLLVLKELQEKCPCAGCVNEHDRLSKADVRALKIKKVGRYGIQIHFSSGCSNGIYEYDFLRKVGEVI